MFYYWETDWHKDLPFEITPNDLQVTLPDGYLQEPISFEVYLYERELVYVCEAGGENTCGHVHSRSFYLHTCLLKKNNNKWYCDYNIIDGDTRIIDILLSTINWAAYGNDKLEKTWENIKRYAEEF